MFFLSSYQYTGLLEQEAGVGLALVVMELVLVVMELVLVAMVLVQEVTGLAQVATVPGLVNMELEMEV